jgi:RHS repeat-associated protein
MRQPSVVARSRVAPLCVAFFAFVLVVLAGHPRPALAGGLPDLIFYSSVEDGEIPPPLDCVGTLDADNDGLLDAHCIDPFDPLDPATIAPPFDRTVATDFYDITRFLYEGEHRIQRGVRAGTIAAYRTAVLRGMVRDELGQPLPGVLVRVLNHAEYGYTYTRADGMFDLVVNGGGDLTVDYQKPGFLHAQRSTNTPWRDWRWLSDVTLIALDTRVTTVNFTGMVTAQIARGSVVSDADGTRQATVIFQPATQAQLVLHDGSTQALPQMQFRATEYTVGEDGPQRMPATLPPASGYTYAVELSADEAIAANARSVRFSRPAAFYLENFLQFPVGAIVPAGYYDHRYGSWLPSDNGRVVQVLSVAGGVAALDVDGQGQAATPERLAALGIGPDERTMLARTYTAGTQLWRAPIAHLTPWDFNWPYTGDPGDQPPTPPSTDDDTDADPDIENSNNPSPPSPPPDVPSDNNSAAPETQGDQDKTEETPECEGGSIVECENQALRERLSVAGTPIALTYDSDRSALVSRNPQARAFSVRVLGSTVPARLQAVTARVVMAGKRVDIDAAPTPNLNVSLTWDGRDAYERLGWQGAVPYEISVGFVYPVVPASTAETFQRGFASFGSGVVVSGASDRGTYTLTRTWFGNNQGRVLNGAPGFSAWDASGLGNGGWSINLHHTFDPRSRTVYYGDGTERRVGVLQSNRVDIATPMATPSGVYVSAFLAASDGSLITQRAELRDKTFYFQPVRIDAHGVEHALTPDYPFTSIGSMIALGDDAVAIPVAEPFPGVGGEFHIARFDADGTRRNLYTINFNSSACRPDMIAAFQGRVLMACNSAFTPITLQELWPNGHLRVLAGGGSATGDGVPATQAKFEPIRDIAVSPNGDIYIAQTYRVRKISPTGIVTTVAGNGSSTQNTADDVPATSVSIGQVYSIELAADDTLYISSLAGSGRIREVRPNGRIYTRVGGGTSGWNTTATAARAVAGAGQSSMQVMPDGSLVLADNGKLHRLAGSAFVPGSDQDEGYAFPSRDGSEVHEFDHSGRHVRTRDALTGATIWQFTYDDAGFLVDIADAYGNRTRIERDAQHQASAIVGPYGARTILTRDANGYLSSITSPAAQTWSMTHTPDGLLTRLQDPLNNASTFAWTLLGKLRSDTNAEGGGWTLNRDNWLSRQAWRTELTSAMGRTRSYTVNDSQSGGRARIADRPGVGSTRRQANPSLLRITDLPNGVRITRGTSADPRFGLQAGMPSFVEVRDGGRTIRRTMQRNANVTAGAGELGTTDLADVVTLSSGSAPTREYRYNYAATTRTTTYRSPEGRTATTTLDAQARPVLLSAPGLAPVEYQYDARGRLVVVAAGSATERRETHLTYDNNGYLASIRDAENRIVALQRDAVGRVLQQTLPDGRQVAFNYDPANRLTRIVPPARPNHDFEYDRIGQLRAYRPPVVPGVNPADTQYTHNLDKQLTRMTRPDGAEVTLNYTASTGLLQSLTAPQGNYNFDYNAGRLQQVEAPGAVRVTRSYVGSIHTAELTHDAVSQAAKAGVQLTYDDYLRVSSVRVSGASAATWKLLNYRYDRDSLVTAATLEGATLNLSRDAGNALLTGTNSGLISDQYAYNAFAETQAYRARINNADAFVAVYVRDKLGRITRKTETVGAATDVYDYRYDLAGRLDTVTRNGTQLVDYSYDGNSNRTSAVYADTHLPATGCAAGLSDVLGTVDMQDRLLRYGHCTYAYTANGELTGKTNSQTGQTTQYNYDVFGNLRQATLPDGRVLSYTIDGLSRRIGKSVNGAPVQGFVYLNQLEPIAELDGAGNIVSAFLYAERGHVPSLMLKGGNSYRIVADHLGSVRLVIDVATGDIAQRLDYDAFGNVIEDTNPGFQPFGYAGGIYDRDLELVRFGARDYDPETGRWLSKDASGFTPGEFNLSQYVGADPINFADLDGRQRAPVRQSNAFNRRTIQQNYGSPIPVSPHPQAPSTPIPVAENPFYKDLFSLAEAATEFFDQAFQIGEYEVPAIPCDLQCKVRPFGPVDTGKMCKPDDGIGPIMHSPDYNPLLDPDCSCRN